MRFAVRSLTFVAALALAVISYADAQTIRGVELGRTHIRDVIAERGQPETEGTVEGGAPRFAQYAGVVFYYYVGDSIVDEVRVLPIEELTRAAALRRLGRPRQTLTAEDLGYNDVYGDTLLVRSSASGVVRFLSYTARSDRSYSARLLARVRGRLRREREDSIREAESRRPAPLLAFGEIAVGRFQPPPPEVSDKGGYAIRTVPPALGRRGLRVGAVVLYLTRVDSTGARYTVEVGDTVVRRLGGWQAAWLDLQPAHGDSVEIGWARGVEAGYVNVRHRDTPAFLTAKANHAVTWALINQLTSGSTTTELQLAAIDSIGTLRRRAAASPVARSQLRDLERLVNCDSIIRSFQPRRRTP